MLKAKALKNLYLIVSVLELFSIKSTMAQPIFVKKVDVVQMPSYCKQSNLNGIELMQLIRIFVSEGDLTDISFAEKVFKTKFNLSYGLTWDSKIDHEHEIYKSTPLLSSPIEIEIFVNNSKVDQLKTGWISYMDVTSDHSGFLSSSEPNFIAECLRITVPKISSFFGGGGHVAVATDGGPITGLSDVGVRKGKANSEISFEFAFYLDNKIIKEITIVQFLSK